jgi:hypothetical protein
VKRALAGLLGFLLLGAMGCRASDHDFDALVQDIERQYSVHAQRVPLMGFVSLCALVKTHGGVRSLQVAQFDNFHGADPQGLSGLLETTLGPEWHPFVRSQRRDHGQSTGDTSLIYVAPQGDLVRMMIVDASDHELNIVRMKMDGKELAQYMQKEARQPGQPLSN